MNVASPTQVTQEDDIALGPIDQHVYRIIIYQYCNDKNTEKEDNGRKTGIA